MSWKIEGPFNTNDSHGWVPQVFGDVVVFRVGRGLFAWDLKKNEKLWRKELPVDESYGNKKSTKCGGNYVTFEHVGDESDPTPIIAVDPRSGETIWRTLVNADCAFQRGLTASREAVFFHGYHEPEEQYNLIKLNARTGDILWEKPGYLRGSDVFCCDEHLFFNTPGSLTVTDLDGEVVHETVESSSRRWILSPGADHTLLAGYMEPDTGEWHLLLLDTRTFEVLGRMKDPAGQVSYTAGVRRGHFATIKDYKVFVIDALKGHHFEDRFSRSVSTDAERIVGTPHGYAILHDCEHSDNRCFSFLDENTGEVLETLELDGIATKPYWLRGRLLAFNLSKLYVITPE